MQRLQWVNSRNCHQLCSSICVPSRLVSASWCIGCVWPQPPKTAADQGKPSRLVSASWCTRFVWSQPPKTAVDQGTTGDVNSCVCLVLLFAGRPVPDGNEWIKFYIGWRKISAQNNARSQGQIQTVLVVVSGIQENGCSVNNGGCEQLCLPSGSIRRKTCACSVGYELSDNKCVGQSLSAHLYSVLSFFFSFLFFSPSEISD